MKVVALFVDCTVSVIGQEFRKVCIPQTEALRFNMTCYKSQCVGSRIQLANVGGIVGFSDDVHSRYCLKGNAAVK